MAATTHLTNDLQAELENLGSPICLESDSTSLVKLNYKDWAWANSRDRHVQASTFVGINDKHLQLEEKGIIACSASTEDLREIAVIIDKWLAKFFEVNKIASEHPSIEINEVYWRLKTLSVEEILEHRWTHLTEEIAKGKISFRKEVFSNFRENFSYLFPFFSHDNLYFSNILELSNVDFKSPLIFCDEQLIWVGFFRDNSESEGRNTFKTKDITEAIKMTKELLLKDGLRTINPLTT